MSQKPKLLVVEDDPGILAQLGWSFDSFDVVTATDKKEALTQLRRFEPGVTTLDLGLPPDPDGVEEGMETLKEILQLRPQTKVIMVTGQSDREHALRAIHLGAYDYYVKPIDLDNLNLVVQRAQYLYDLEKENHQLNELKAIEKFPNLLTNAPNMQKICRTLEKISATDITTLLLGESGTGKEVLAKGIHQLSPRTKGPFVAINCAAIPENLLESELFGYEKGAFTGAVKQTLGKIELAHQGTLFLDEIGDLPQSLQPKLLRFLQERTLERLGGRKEIQVDVRVIGATHQNLQELIQNQLFREDLYYRISEMSLSIPPLRDREQDALMLSIILMKRFARQYNVKVKGFTEQAKDAILHYTWPGNVRELENRIKRAVVMAEETLISHEELELPFVDSNIFPFNLKEVRDEAERKAVVRALSYVQGNMTKASELLGVTRPTLYHLIEKLDIREQVNQ